MRQTNSLPLFSWLGASTRASSGVVRRVGVPLFVLLAAVLVAPALDAGQAVSKPRLSTAPGLRTERGSDVRSVR